MRKRSIAVVLALLMVCGLVLPVMAAASLKPFADVPEHHWAYESVLQLQAAGLVEGYPDGEYKGQRPMTRYELAMVIARFLARLDSRIADQLEALRPGMVEEVSAEVSDLIKDEFAKAMAAIDAAKADASAEAKDELEKAKLELAKAIEAVEPTKVVGLSVNFKNASLDLCPEYFESKYNLPVEDVYNNGAAKLLDAIFEYLEG